MYLSNIKIHGFRNFENIEINLEEKSLIIGANDVGKTNLLFALRLFLDRSLSDLDIEPQDSDFHVKNTTNEFSIILKFKNVIEDCIQSKMRGFISDENELFLAYFGYRDPVTNIKTYSFQAGLSESSLEIIEERYYRKVLNLKYIGSKRDLYSFIKREKRNLLEIAKSKREQEEINLDSNVLKTIEYNLNSVNDNISQLSFIKNATLNINKELNELSFHNSNQEIFFDVGSSDTSKFIENIQLASKVNDRSIAVGGDGRNNQIFLALWAARNDIQQVPSLPLEVTIYCIEEPEAHLHPHQQRKLAEYLSTILKGQVIITSHSPQIASEFSPNCIVRLYEYKRKTKVASNGCGKLVGNQLIEFGYRRDIISSEAFFANVVLLVEGPSEVLLYKALAREINLDLDRLNISILMVDGVGFQTYIQLFNALEIKWVMRTDNDLMKIPTKDKYRMAGIERGISIYKLSNINDPEFDELIRSESSLLKFESEFPSTENIISSRKFIEKLRKFNIFLAEKDLETDLSNSDIFTDLSIYHKKDDKKSLVDIMQKQKATSLYYFLSENHRCLSKLVNDNISIPLITCKNIIEEMYD